MIVDMDFILYAKAQNQICFLRHNLKRIYFSLKNY